MSVCRSLMAASVLAFQSAVAAAAAPLNLSAPSRALPSTTRTFAPPVEPAAAATCPNVWASLARVPVQPPAPSALILLRTTEAAVAAYLDAHTNLTSPVAALEKVPGQTENTVLAAIGVLFVLALGDVTLSRRGRPQ